MTEFISKSLNCLLEEAVVTIGVFRHRTLTNNLVVTNMRFFYFNNHNSALSRVIGLLLMVLIFYGTTVEAAHRHGKVLPTHACEASLGAPGEADTSLSTKSGCNDCLICQLHQNFSTSLIGFHLNHPPIQLREDLLPGQLRTASSETLSLSAGRAPPSIS